MKEHNDFDVFDKRNGANNRPADIYRFSWHGWNGELAERGKLRSTQKIEAALHIDRLKNWFNVTDLDIMEAKLKDVENENSSSLRSSPKIPEWKKPIAWKRDHNGNII